MRKEVAALHCADCHLVYGTLYEVEQASRPGVFANETVPEVIPKRCSICCTEESPDKGMVIRSNSTGG